MDAGRLWCGDVDFYNVMAVCGPSIFLVVSEQDSIKYSKGQKSYAYMVLNNLVLIDPGASHLVRQENPEEWCLKKKKHYINHYIFITKKEREIFNTTLIHLKSVDPAHHGKPVNLIERYHLLLAKLGVVLLLHGKPCFFKHFIVSFLCIIREQGGCPLFARNAKKYQS